MLRVVGQERDKRRSTMSSTLRLVVGLFGLGLATMPADAGSSRSANFLFACDGTNKTANLSLSGFPANTAQFILGGEVTLFENTGGLQYVILRGEGNPQKQVLSLSKTDNTGRIGLPTFYQVAANAAGNVAVTVDGACNGGTGQIQGNVTIYFN
jgi:hypothetical protein